MNKIKLMNTASQTTEVAENLSNSNNSKIKIELLDGSGNTESFTKAKKALEKAGYTVDKTGTTTSTSKTTIINKTSLPSDTLSKLKDLLGIGNISNSNSSTNKVDITIIIGKDYK